MRILLKNRCDFCSLAVDKTHAALEHGCERLFTDDFSRSSRDGGRHYGLGLHAASEAANAHGGSVSLANSPSGGAVATIAVPLCGA